VSSLTVAMFVLDYIQDRSLDVCLQESHKILARSHEQFARIFFLPSFLPSFPPSHFHPSPLDKDQSIEGHSSHSAPRGSLKTLSPPSENTGKLLSSNGNHRSPLLAGTPKQERPSRDSLSDVNAPLLGNTLSVSRMKAISRRGQLREPLRMRIERQTTSEVTSDVHKFSHKETRETSSMEKANHIEEERLSVSVRELAGTKIAGDQLAEKDERDTKSTAGSKQPTSGQLSSIRRAGEASSINSHSLAHSEDAIGVLSSKIPNNPKRGYETDRIPISKQRTNFVDKQLPAKPDLEYDHEKQLLFQYIMETNPHWLTWDESKVAKNIITNTRRMSMVTRRTIRSTTMTELIQTKDGIKIVKKPKPTFGPEVIFENDTRPFMNLTPFEEKGGNIMFTLRTTYTPPHTRTWIHAHTHPHNGNQPKKKKE